MVGLVTDPDVGVRKWLDKQQKQMIKFGFGRIENIAGNEKMLVRVHQHFCHFPLCFQNLSLSGVIRGRDCVVKG